MELISDYYRELNKTLHTVDPKFGVSGHRWADMVIFLGRKMVGPTVLDYGCGKSSLSNALGPLWNIQEYDPAIPGKDAEPKPADLVVCTDVLEHIEPDRIDNVIEHLHSLTQRRLLFAIAIRPAKKELADGRNAHLIVENADWWKHKLSRRFHIETSRVDEDYQFSGEATPLKQIELVPPISALTDDERASNIIANISKVSKRLPMGVPVHSRKAILVCYGPSLLDTWPSVYMAKELGHDIVTVSGSHKFLLEKNITPKIHIDCDPRERKARQFGKPDKDVQYWMGSCVDPLYIEILQGHDVSLWHTHNGEKSEQFIWEIEPHYGLVIGGGSVGLRAISVLYWQGYRDIEIHGMDCSFPEKHITHAGEHLAPKPKTHTAIWEGREFITSGSFLSYAIQFNEDKRLWPGMEIRLHGDGLLQHMQRSSTT